MPGKASQAAAKKTYAQLVAANYKILKPQQSARLLRYGDAAFACMAQDLELGNPRTSPTKIGTGCDRLPAEVLHPRQEDDRPHAPAAAFLVAGLGELLSAPHHRTARRLTRPRLPRARVPAREGRESKQGG